MTFRNLQAELKLWQQNQKYARQIMRKHTTQQFGEFTICTGNAKYLKEIQRLHLHLFRDPIPRWLVWLYRFRASDLMTIALDKNGKVAAYQCFMMNEHEISQHIIHEVYVAVSDSYQGKGLATALRRFSIESYDFGNLLAISTVARTNDIKALRSAQKAGFTFEKMSVKPPGQYLIKHLSIMR